MSQEQPQGEETTDFTPERWEIAIEDAAELVALLLERSQTLYQDLSELAKRRPVLVGGLAAVGAGALIGTIYASTRARRRSAASNVVVQASAVAQAAAEKLSQGPGAIRSVRRMVTQSGTLSSDPKKRIVETSRSAQDVMRLVPIVVAVLKNPFVRRVLWRYARGALRR